MISQTDESTESALLLKPSRAAQLLDCSRSSIYDLVNEGTLHGIRVRGLSLRIPLAEIHRVIRVGIVKNTRPIK
jgi:excisionase family DNA binding protein